MKKPTNAAAVSANRRSDNSGALPPLISLKCELCTEYLQDPVTLPCLHSFCRICLEKYNTKRLIEDKPQVNEEKSEFEKEFPRQREVNTVQTESQEEFLSVQCPTCIETLKLPQPKEPQVPFQNSRLARIVGLVRESNVLCQNCRESASEVKCKTCNAWLCLECYEVTHEAPIFKSHEVEKLSHAEMFTLPKCDTHPENDLEFFSTEDEVGVCQVCLLKGDFVGKPYCLVGDVRKVRQYEVENGVRQVIEEKEKLLVGRQKMEQTQEILVKNLETQQKEVRSNFAAIRAALDKREKETLKALAELEDAKQNVLSTQIKQTDHILSVINDGVRNVKLILNHSNDLELVYLTIVLQEFVADLSNLGAKMTGSAKKLNHFYSAAVDAELPVKLSAKVADLVSAYAPVPRATFKEESGKKSGKLSLAPQKMTKEHVEILQEVGAEEKAEEYGCVVQ